MAGFCLPKFAADVFRGKLLDGSINPSELADMSSADRRAFFQKFLSEEHAKQVNANFESKLLLKNQQAGLVRWAKETLGMNPAARRALIDKVNRMDEILQPADLDKFLADLVEKRLGLGVTAEEANKIAELASAAERAKAQIKLGGDRLDYGVKKKAFDRYTNDLLAESRKFKLSDIKGQGMGIIPKGISELGGLAKSTKASLDNSFIGRQGYKTMFTNPVLWARNAAHSFEYLVKQLGKKASENDVLDAILAEVESRPNAIDGTYSKMKLAIGTAEEAFPTSLPERIPLFGRAFKASQVAFNGTAYRLRADLADRYLWHAKNAGVDITEPKVLESMGRVINSLTGRGSLGPLEPVAGYINNFFFSARFFKSNIDMLTAHQFDPNITPYMRKVAAMNLAKVIVGMGSIIYMANTIKPGSVSLDFTNADAAKLKIGNTRFELTAGMGSILILLTRLGLRVQTSSVSGKKTEIGTGKFGAPSLGSLLLDFASNKTSPLLSTIASLYSGYNRNNKPVNLTTLEGTKNVGMDLFAPLSLQNYLELKNTPNAAPVWLGMMADTLGVSTNTYTKTKFPQR